MKKIQLLIVLFWAFFGYAQNGSTISLHDTKGVIDVDAGGQLTYTLPIALPPGVKSVAPQMNLVYNSGSSNGIAGYGWNLSGLTGIRRISSTIEKDGAIKGVQLDYSDYYSFNGQRLLLKSGTYGKDGAEYVTEKYSNMRIKSLGNSGNIGPEYWEVTFEDGSQAWYGKGDATTLTEYNISKWKDAQGNYITYTYTKKANVTSISTIEWGGNEALGKAHFNKITFAYQKRAALEQSYLKGQEFIRQDLLKGISVESNSNVFKKYSIDYKNITSTLYEVVAKITEFNSKNEAANPVEFNYQNTNISVESMNFPYKGDDKVVGDFDGDGTLDYIKYVNTYEKCNKYEYFTPKKGDNNRKCIEYETVPASLTWYNSFFGTSTLSTSVTTGMPFTLEEFKKGIAISYEKKNGVLTQKQSLLIQKDITISGSKRKDIVLEVYGLEEGKLTLQFSKQLPLSNYLPKENAKICYNSDGSECGRSVLNSSLIKGIKETDFDGDGKNEFVFLIEEISNITYKGKAFSDGVPCLEADFAPPGKKSPILSLLPTTSTKRYALVLEMNENAIEYRTIFQISKALPFNKNNIDFDPDSTPDIEKYKNTEFLDLFAKDRTGDFDGDGKIDILTFLEGKPYLAQLYKNKNANTFEIKRRPYFSDNDTGYIGIENREANLGDFNGDGRTDIIVPNTLNNSDWWLYIATDKGFKKQLISGLYNYRPFEECPNNGGCRGKYLSRRINYQVTDMDKDGKSEFVVVNNYVEWVLEHPGDYTDVQISVFKPKFNGTTYEFFLQDDRSYHYDEQMYDFSVLTGDFGFNNTMNKLLLLGTERNKKGDKAIRMSYIDMSKATKINQITQNGIVTDVVYKELENTTNNSLYSKVKQEAYPYLEFENLKNQIAVSQLKQAGRIQDFLYAGLVNHLQGRGMLGFKKIARSSWYAQGLENTKMWSVTQTDPLRNGIPVMEWTTRDASLFYRNDIDQNTSGLLSFKKTEYTSTKLAYGVEALVPTKIFEKDFLKGTTATTTTEYDSYYLPKEHNQDIAGISNKKTVLGYEHNDTGLGKDYYVGRLVSKQEEVTAYYDTKKSKTEFGYTNNLLTTHKKYSFDENQYVTDTYTYDGFGNVTSKTISNSVDSQMRSESFTYDDKGRFVLKKKDALGLESESTYNDFGQVLTQKNPIGITETYQYDSWGKILKYYHPLQGYTTYDYSRQDNNTVVSKNLPDGSIHSQFTNAKGEEILTRIKANLAGDFVDQQTTYDILGRKIASSDPYTSGKGYIKWNTITYDDSVFPAKVTVISSNGKVVDTKINGSITEVTELNGYQRVTQKVQDALGNMTSSTDKGGTINYNYNATGQMISARYGANTVRTTYDNWGRKSSFQDPSNGTYLYEYNALGQMTNEVSPKGNKEYLYNTLGQLIRQKENSNDGVSTKKDIQFSYDSLGRLTQVSGVCNDKNYSKNFVFDSQGRLVESRENSNGRSFTQKNIVYDGIGRVVSYEKEIYSGGIYTKAILENEYSNWNGALVAIKDKNTQKVLWRLGETTASGKVLTATLGAISIRNTYDYTDFLSTVKHTLDLQGQTPVSVLDLGYSFDAIKNELKNRNRNGNLGNLKENFVYDDNNRLVNWTNLKTGSLSYNVYDEKGRITENDQVGNMYFENRRKIYQNTSIDLNTTGVQNYPDEDTALQIISYNENNDPIYIDGKKGDYAFEYGLTESRQVMYYGGNFSLDQATITAKFTKYYSEDGSFEVVRDNATGQEKHLLYIGGTPYDSNIVYVKNYAETDAKPIFLHKDYLGTILAITDEKGKIVEERHFDAWGNLTHGSMQVLDRGYTSHEHLQDVGLIHMNGRLYDPMLRRFLNADENIQDPTNTQCYNKYGYVMNNPLMFNDPSGEIIPLLVAVGIGAAVGLFSYTAITYFKDGSLKYWNIGGALKSTFWGAVSGAVSFGVGSIFSSTAGVATALADSIKQSVGAIGLSVVQAGTHAVTQGVLSLMQGGDFWSAALSGGLGSLGASAFGAIGGDFAKSTLGTITFGAISGGIGAELSGGNFWQGAVIGGMVAGLNHGLHKMASKIAFKKDLISKMKKGNIDPGGKPDFTQTGVDKMNKGVEGLNDDYEISGRPRVSFDCTDPKESGHTDPGHVHLNKLNIKTNYRYASTLFHEYRHAWQYLYKWDSWVTHFGVSSANYLKERDAYGYTMQIGVYNPFDTGDTFIKDNFDFYINLTKHIKHF